MAAVKQEPTQGIVNNMSI